LTFNIEVGDRVKSDLDGKYYTIMKILNATVTLKSSDGKEIMTGIISFKIHYKEDKEK
jgi:hypothetical protein